MSDVVEQRFPDPIGEALRRQLNNLTVAASFAEAVARWRYVRLQERAERDARAAEQATRAAEQAAADEEVIRRFNQAQRRAAGGVYGRAFDNDFLLRADLRTLGETWVAAAAYRDDPRAAEAMTRVEIRLRVLHPEAMARYDQLRADGITPGEAMFKAVRLMDPGGPEPSEGQEARPAGHRAGAVDGGPAAGGELVRVGSSADVPRPAATEEMLAHLRNVDVYLSSVAAASPGDEAAAARIAEVRAGVRRNIDHIEGVLRSGGRSTSVGWAYERAMGRWVRLETQTPPSGPGADVDPAGRFNEAQRQAASSVFSRAFDDDWLQRADVRQLGETWAAAAAYPGDRRAVAARERVETALRGSEPAAMTVYDSLRGLGHEPGDAMLRSVPLMEPGRAPLSPGELPNVAAATRLGDVPVPPVAEPMPSGRSGRQHVENRLRELDQHLAAIVASGPRGRQWQEQAGQARNVILGEIVAGENGAGSDGLAGQDGGDATRLPRNAADLAGEGFPQTAETEVANARQTRASDASTQAASPSTAGPTPPAPGPAPGR
ncbi:hypothetical protein [Micromonospora sp. CPCC 206061]|uniref:hypothetical protein n=1 Tax=Micromonospora sp. CPCC 206061 TaxID=3122410 RepID=UPI002FF39BB2